MGICIAAQCSNAINHVCAHASHSSFVLAQLGTGSLRSTVPTLIVHFMFMHGVCICGAPQRPKKARRQRRGRSSAVESRLVPMGRNADRCVARQPPQVGFYSLGRGVSLGTWNSLVVHAKSLACASCSCIIGNLIIHSGTQFLEPVCSNN